MLFRLVLMSYQFPHKLELNVIFDMCSCHIYMRLMLFNLLKSFHSFKNGLYYRQTLFLAFVFQNPELPLSLCKVGRKRRQKWGDRVGRFPKAGKVMVPQTLKSLRQSLGQSPRKEAGFPEGNAKQGN